MTERKSMNLFQRFWLAITTPKGFNSLFQQGFGRGLTTLLLACFITSLTAGLAASSWIYLNVPRSPEFLVTLKEDLRTLFPEELEVSIVDGSLSMNQQAPYSIAIPTRWQELLDENSEESFPYLLTIDPSGNVEDFVSYNSLLLLTEKAIVYPSKSGSSEASDLESMQTSFMRYDADPSTANFFIDAEKYRTFEAQLEPFIDKIPSFVKISITALIFALPFFAAFFSWAWMLLYLCFAVLLVWMVSLFMKKSYTYGQLYLLSMYGVIAPLLLKAVGNFFSVDLPFLSFTVVFVLWMGCVLKYMAPLTEGSTKAKKHVKKNRA